MKNILFLLLSLIHIHMYSASNKNKPKVLSYAEAIFKDEILDVFSSLDGKSDFELNQYGSMIPPTYTSTEAASSSDETSSLPQELEEKLIIQKDTKQKKDTYIQLISHDNKTYSLLKKYAHPNLLNLFYEIKSNPNKKKFILMHMDHQQVETVKKLIEQIYILKNEGKSKKQLLKAASRTSLPTINTTHIDFTQLPPTSIMQLQHFLHSMPKEKNSYHPVHRQLLYLTINKQYKDLLSTLIPYTQSENNLLFKAIALQWIRYIKRNKPYNVSTADELTKNIANLPTQYQTSILNLLNL